MRFIRATMVIPVLGLSLGANWAVAQGERGTDLAITMKLMHEDADLPSDVMRELTLPAFPAAASQDDGDPRPGESSSSDGLGIANSVRETAGEDGRAIADAAIEAAHDNREDLGRGSPPNFEDLVPGDVPGDAPGSSPDGVPGPPDGVPGPPDGVPGPP